MSFHFGRSVAYFSSFLCCSHPGQFLALKSPSRTRHCLTDRPASCFWHIRRTRLFGPHSSGLKESCYLYQSTVAHGPQSLLNCLSRLWSYWHKPFSTPRRFGAASEQFSGICPSRSTTLLLPKNGISSRAGPEFYSLWTSFWIAGLSLYTTRPWSSSGIFVPIWAARRYTWEVLGALIPEISCVELGYGCHIWRRSLHTLENSMRAEVRLWCASPGKSLSGLVSHIPPINSENAVITNALSFGSIWSQTQGMTAQKSYMKSPHQIAYTESEQSMSISIFLYYLGFSHSV